MWVDRERGLDANYFCFKSKEQACVISGLDQRWRSLYLCSSFFSSRALISSHVVGGFVSSGCVGFAVVNAIDRLVDGSSVGCWFFFFEDMMLGLFSFLSCLVFFVSL